MNKKVIVPFLSSVIGLSVAGGLGGAFAWYQFSSQVTTSFIGTSVAEGGLLQIGYYDDDAHKVVWGRDLVKENAKIVPVTFGALKTRTSDNKANCLGDKAYGRPEAGRQGGNDYTSGWEVMSTGYYQYDIYLRALEADASAEGDASHDVAPGYKQVAKPVYLSDVHIEGVGETAQYSAGGKTISDAVRIHLDVEGATNPNRLISKAKIAEANKLPLFGELDLDGDGESDKFGGYDWDPNKGQTVIYGINGEYQTTIGATADDDGIVQHRDAQGDMPASTPEQRNAKTICFTKDGTDAWTVKITVTVWLEGWQLLNNNATDASKKGTIWNPILSGSNIPVRVGMTFDAGRNLGSL